MRPLFLHCPWICINERQTAPAFQSLQQSVLGHHCNQALYQAGEQRKSVPRIPRCLALHLYTESRYYTCALLQNILNTQRSKSVCGPPSATKHTHLQRKPLKGSVSYFSLKVDFPPPAPLSLTALQSREHSSHGGQTSYVCDRFSLEHGGSDLTASEERCVRAETWSLTSFLTL